MLEGWSHEANQVCFGSTTNCLSDGKISPTWALGVGNGSPQMTEVGACVAIFGRQEAVPRLYVALDGGRR